MAKVPTVKAIRAVLGRTIQPDSSTLVEYPDHVWCSFTKGEASAKLEFHAGWVNWTDIQSPGELGWLEAAHEMVRDEFPKLGVVYLEASGGAGPTCNEEQLKAHGPWEEVPSGRLRWDL